MNPVALIRLWNRTRRTDARERRRERARRGRAPLAVMGIVRNEAWNIDEWISHYLWQGASHIFLIDNGSTDDTLARIMPWVERGLVTLDLRPKRHRQAEHYREAFRRHRLFARFEWLLIADADEFWFVRDGRNLPEALSDFSDSSVIYCNWRLFGSAGHAAHPESLRRDLVMRHPGYGANRSTKWIARTAVLRGRRNIAIHKVRGAGSDVTLSANETFQLNHYGTQSRAFWETVKMVRGDALNPESERLRDLEVFATYEEKCTVEDRVLADRVAAQGVHFGPVGARGADRPSDAAGSAGSQADPG